MWVELQLISVSSIAFRYSLGWRAADPLTSSSVCCSSPAWFGAVVRSICLATFQHAAWPGSEGFFIKSSLQLHQIE